MKTLVLSMISIAATVAAMTACTSESDEIDNVIDAPVEIKLNAGINTITTKADGIQNKDIHDFDANIIASSATGTYTSSLWTEAEAGKIQVKNNTVSFSKKQSYPSNGNTIYMRAYAPAAGNLTSGVVKFVIDGNKDIMISKEISGNKTNATSKTLEFSHLLSQLNFTVKAENEEAQTAWGKITGIKVLAIENLELTLSSGDLVAKSEAAQKLSTASFTEIAQLPTAEPAASAGYVMVQPQNDAYQVVVLSENGPTEGRTITLSAPTKTEPSTAYNILLTFSATEITASATVGEWTTSDTVGSGSVD